VISFLPSIGQPVQVSKYLQTVGFLCQSTSKMKLKVVICILKTVSVNSHECLNSFQKKWQRMVRFVGLVCQLFCNFQCYDHVINVQKSIY